MSATLAPDDVVRTHAEAERNNREPLLVMEPLGEFLRSSGLDAADDLDAAFIGEGHSNVTFLLSTGVVVRRPPRGPLPPSAHDVLREARLLRDLAILPIGALAYGSLFVFLATFIRWALLLGLLFAFGWESWVPSLPGDFARISLMAYLRALAPHPQPQATRDIGNVSGRRGDLQTRTD